MTPSVFVLFIIFLAGLLSIVAYMMTKTKVLALLIWIVSRENYNN